MSEHGSMNGAEWLARALAGAGTTHVFFVESVLRRTLLQLKDLGVTPILAHSEKAAAYMADGYARVAGRPGVCMAQSVGAANLASGLQDPFLGRSPVVALTGRKPPSFQHRNAYQEIPHAPLFAAVTKFSTTGRSRPPSCRACCATPGAPPWPTRRGRPISTSPGMQGDEIELGQTAEPPMIDPEARSHSGAPAGRRRARHRARRRGADRRPPGRDRRRRRGCRLAGGAGGARPGRGAAGAGRHDARRARHHPDPASAVGRGRRQLFRAAGQPHRARRRSRAVHRLRHRRPGHAELDRAAARHEDRADRRRSAGDRAQLSEHDRPRRRPESDPGPARPGHRASRRAIPALPTRRRGSSRIGAPR